MRKSRNLKAELQTYLQDAVYYPVLSGFMIFKFSGNFMRKQNKQEGPQQKNHPNQSEGVNRRSDRV